MALLREVDTLDEVPEAYRPMYKATGEGKFVNEDIEDVSGLKNAAKARKAEREAVERELAPYKELGLSAADLAAVKARITKERDGSGGEKDPEALVAKRLAPIQAEKDALAAELRQLKLTDKIREAFLAAGGRKEDVEDVVVLTTRQFDLNDKGKIVVKDAEGDPTGLSPQEWFEKEYKGRKPNLFNGTGAAGGGATGGGTGGSGADADIRNLPGGRMIEAAFAGGKTK